MVMVVATSAVVVQMPAGGERRPPPTARAGAVTHCRASPGAAASAAILEMALWGCIKGMELPPRDR